MDSEPQSQPGRPILPLELDDSGPKFTPSRASRVSSQSIRKLMRFIFRSGPAHEYEFFGESTNESKLKVAAWHKGARLCLTGALFCLAVDVVFLIVSLNQDHVVQGHGVLYEGSCQKVKHLQVLLLVPLNFTGTLLIGASNYMMQCLNSPSRQEVDKAHANGRFLNIGVSSLTNTRYLGWRKTLLWGFIGLSTIPMHLLLNSTVFASLQFNNYGVMVADSGFLENSTMPMCDASESTSATIQLACEMYDTFRATNSNGELLQPKDCIKRYFNTLGTGTSNVMLVTKDATDSSRWSLFAKPTNNEQNFSVCNNQCSADILKSRPHSLIMSPHDPLWNATSVLGMWTALDYNYLTTLQYLHFNMSNSRMTLANQWEPYAWICDTGTSTPFQTCGINDPLQYPTDWRVTPNSLAIDHCWVEPGRSEHCKLHYSVVILAILILCDLVKVCCMGFAIRLSGRGVEQHELATLGDAIESFLTTPDETSAGRCLVDQKRVRSLMGPLFSWQYDEDYFEGLSLRDRILECARVFGPIPLQFHATSPRWLATPSRSRTAAFFSLFVLVVGAAVTLLSIGMASLNNLGVSDVWSQGIESINPNAVFTATSFSGQSSTGIFRTILLINMPQLLLSVLYFLYNGLLTSMMCTHEFSKFSLYPTTLRVSIPSRQQRSTYWLSLPWKISLPLIMVSAAIHWLLSRSLFLVQIEVIDWTGTAQKDRDISACGYNPLAMSLVLATLFAMLLALLAVGSKRLPPGAPVVGTCSWAISAACHDLAGEKDAALKPLMWGEVDADDQRETRHCSISSRKVSLPKEGQLYA